MEGFYYDKMTRSFYESVGLYAKSSVQRLIPNLNDSTLSVDSSSVNLLPSEYFGEGLAPRSATEFALLTYKERKIFTVDRSTMKIQSSSFAIPAQL